MSGKHMVLAAIENDTERKALTEIFDGKYDIEETASADEAFSVLDRMCEKISVIVVSFEPTKIYEFLKVFRTRSESTLIPVVVISEKSECEAKVLSLGAYDFIKEPCDPQIISLRIENVLLKSQYTSLREMKTLYERDSLTGIYNKNKFIKETHKMLLNNPDRKFFMVRFDINRFHLINAYFGAARGDKILIDIARALEKELSNFDVCTYGRSHKDVFMYCIPADNKKTIEKTIKNMDTFLKKEHSMFKMQLCGGIYAIENNTASVVEMYDKANVASKGCKDSYTNYFEYYTKTMDDKAKEEQEIVNDMEGAVANGEFEVWYQPKYDIMNNVPMGAEALVRWRHPKHGLISPGKFIPVFENNGFISTLDVYVWEQTCRDLAFWISKGIRLPISINVSRVNLIELPIVDILNSLTKKYNIPHELLNIEVTESVYTEQPKLLIDIVNRLKSEGYLIFMDDFGSGYSSLSLLKDIDVNVLKIDMQFFEEGILNVRSKNILLSIIRMAKLLNMSIIAEGVETEEQVGFLKAWGCDYVQGYYFAKPMPKSDYENYMIAASE